MNKVKTITSTVVFLALAGLFAPAVQAGEADVVGVHVSKALNGTYEFDVAVAHADQGWDHYADGFDVVAPDGKVLAHRVLAHPHVNEQPFTRSIRNVKIPKDIGFVTVRAHDKIHDLGGKSMRVEMHP